MPDYGFIANGSGPIDQLGKIATTFNAVNQNKLFQGQQAAGAALQQSIDPNTGQVDFQKAASLIASQPNIAPYAMEAVKNLLVTQGQGITNTTNQTALQGTYTANLRQDYLAAQRAGEDPHMALIRGIAMGRYPAQMAQSFAGGDTLPGGVSQDQLAKESAIALGPSAVTAAYGTPETQNIGDKDVTSLVNPALGTKTVMGGNGAVIPRTLSPSDKVARVPTVGPNGEPETVPQASLSTDTGEPKTSGVAGPGGTLPTALPPGEAEARAGPKVAAAGQSADLNRANEGSVARAAQLHELLGAQGDFRSGPGAAKWSGIVTEFNRIFNTSLANDAASSQQTFGKIAEQVAEAQRGAMGSAATNAQTEAARIASPNTTYSPEANKRVIALLLGNEDYIQTKTKAWQAAQKHGWSPSEYNDFVTEFNQLYDPRYFAERYMTPQQKTQLQGEMGDQGYQQFEAKRNKALAYRW